MKPVSDSAGTSAAKPYSDVMILLHDPLEITSGIASHAASAVTSQQAVRLCRTAGPLERRAPFTCKSPAS